MPASNSLIVNKVDLKKMVTSLGISEASTEAFLGRLDKMHQHIDAVGFVGMLEKLGIRQKDIANILRRIGFTDTKIVEVFNLLDEAKIETTFGKVVQLKVD